MSKGLLFTGCTLALAMFFAVPFRAQAACSIVGGQQFCDNSPEPAQSAAPGGFSTQGIFGCGNAPGSMSQSVGTMGAIGGAFVPVNDASVTLNSGSIVYKECVLRGMVDRQREAAIAALVKQSTNQFMTGRNGNPMFPESLVQDQLNRSDTIVASAINGTRLNMLNPAFRDDVKLAVNRAYYAQTRDTSGALACSYAGTPEQLNAVLHARQFNNFYDVLALTDPNCIPLSAFYGLSGAKNLVMNDVAADEEEMMTRLNWSNGVYGVETVDANGVRRTLTPGFFVAGTIQQHLGSGFRQQESANDIDQIVGSLFAGIGNALISQAVGGLRGLVQNAVGGRSYIDLVVQDSSSRLNETAVNAGLQVLVAARQSEAAYLAAKQAIKGLLFQTASQLRAAENVCWNTVVPAAMNYAATGGCTPGTACSVSSFTLKIATSTAFSQAVINVHIAPLATSSEAAITASAAALGQIDQLLVGITATSSPITQSAVLHQLDGMVAQGQLHNQYDVQAAQQQAQDAQGALSTLLTDTAKRWGDTPLSATDPNSGWCNINNPDVIKMWALKWKL